MKLFKPLIAAACGLGLTFGGSAALAEDAIGDWVGNLKAPSRELRMAVHISKQAAGGLTGTMDSLDQGARGLPLANIKATPDNLIFEAPSIKGRYEAKWDASTQKWAGNWSQGPYTLQLDLTRGKAEPAATIHGLDGDWDGVIDVNGAKLRLAFHVKTTTAEGTVATFDSIDQNATGLPISEIHKDDGSVTLISPTGLRFAGTLAPDGRTIAGEWRSGPIKAPLMLARRTGDTAAPALLRPQTPVPPFPYRQEDVSYDNPVAAGVRLAGTLTLPPGQGPFPAVVLIAGSGRNARDEEIFGHKLFLVLADHLTRQGLAVLRYDKRGVGASTGDYDKATSRDFASDTEAALAYMRQRKDIDARRIGLIGHSEGGLIAPMVAADGSSKEAQVAFIVLMAGPGVDGTRILLEQGRLIRAAFGLDAKDQADAAALSEKLFATLRDEPADKAQAEVLRLLVEYGDAHGQPREAAEARARMLASDWLKLFMTYDPAETLRRVSCPVLAVAGSKDLQVPTKENLDAIRAALADNKDVTIEELPGLNHLFQEAKTGSPIEYGTIEQTMSPAVLNLISTWIAPRLALPNARRESSASDGR